MTISSVQHSHFSVKKFLQKNGRELEKHIEEKFINRFWLGEVLTQTEGRISSYFPHKPQLKGSAKIGDKRFPPTLSIEGLPEGVSKKPAFLVNIPLAHTPLAEGFEKVEALIEKLKDETFGTDAAESQDQAQKKLAVVFGINQFQSIDPEVNSAFKRYIWKMPLLEGLSYRVTGFFWIPSWVANNSWKDIKGVSEALEKKSILKNKIYPSDKAFRVLKGLDHEQAEKVRQELEGENGLSEELRSQIPYQHIRQTIKDSSCTKDFAKNFSEKPNLGPVFYVTMDGDCAKLRSTENGYFSHYEEIIEESWLKKKYIPSVISLGYQLSDDDLPLSRLAVTCDQAVREAMHQYISGSVYFPEPGTGYYLFKGGELLKNLKKFSFLSGKEKDGKAFESRRAINNGVRSGILDRSKFVFKSVKALITAMPGRMATPIAIEYEELNAADLKKERVLKGLRGIPQVHFHSFDWAHYVYEGLPQDLKTGPSIYGRTSRVLSAVFAPFDPISLIDNYFKIYKASFADVFDKILGFYEEYSQALFEGEREGNYTIARRLGPQIKLPAKLERKREFIQSQFSLLLEAKDELAELGFTDEWQEKVIDAARASGLAFFSTLREEMGKL